MLDEIVRLRRCDVEALKARRPLAAVRSAAAAAAPPRSLKARLEGGRSSSTVRVIAEVKRASPSRGDISPHCDPVETAAAYEAAGAAAVSVLTEERHFKGSLDFLSAVRARVAVPVLRKDFIFDPYQLYEARGGGADAVLLIAAVLDDVLLRELMALSGELGMDALVEVHDEGELERVVEAGAGIIGINNRDLRDLTLDLETTARLAPLVPEGKVVVSESGIGSAADVVRLSRFGVDAFLVGSSLMAHADPGGRLAELVGALGEASDVAEG
ncbi:MAG TPA: indole-3-glycerol phosphate synthase TrpC [Deltaproteobacteria bacterium]|nr:indole-3-glycerol phosphate synthase TrpC [Deltaproteobacteria bacterium]